MRKKMIKSSWETILYEVVRKGSSEKGIPEQKPVTGGNNFDRVVAAKP